MHRYIKSDLFVYTYDIKAGMIQSRGMWRWRSSEDRREHWEVDMVKVHDTLERIVIVKSMCAVEIH